MVKCHICHNEIEIIAGMINSIKYIGDQPTCHDCYFNALGNMMEKHPPGFHKHV